MIWFGWLLWYINHCRLFNAKSSLYIYIKYIGFGLVGFYDISTIVGYLMSNPLYTYILNIYDLVWSGFNAVTFDNTYCWLKLTFFCLIILMVIYEWYYEYNFPLSLVSHRDNFVQVHCYYYHFNPCNLFMPILIHDLSLESWLQQVSLGF